MTQLWCNSNSTCRATYWMYIPSFKLISQSMLKKSPENADGRTDGWTDGRTDIATVLYVPFFKRTYKNEHIWIQCLIKCSFLWSQIFPRGNSATRRNVSKWIIPDLQLLGKKKHYIIKQFLNLIWLLHENYEYSTTHGKVKHNVQHYHFSSGTCKMSISSKRLFTCSWLCEWL